MDFPAAKDYILSRLEHELDPRLVYHSYIHTVDVLKTSTALSLREKISEEDQLLVETAALFHDAGMLNGYDNHEENSASIAADILKRFSYTANQIGIICDLIRDTRLPQMASTTLGKILCDADLDYLGRDDFFINSFCLKLEWQIYGIKTYSLSEWFVLQEEFLQRHTYLSDSAIEIRNQGKLKNLTSIKAFNQRHLNQTTQTLYGTKK